jgi:hypothetical protein
MTSSRRELHTVLLWVVLLASSALLLALQWNLTFYQDTWAFLLERRGWSLDDFFRPHNEHLVALSLLVTKLCVEIFGMTNPRPEITLMTLTLSGTGALLFLYVRRRTDPWLALMATSLILFLGSAWMILLWPFEISFSAPVMAGLGALLLLEREDARGDAWACLLLIVSVGFGSLGLCFVAAAFVGVVLKRRRRGLSRGYVAVVPAILFLAWYVGWGHTAESHLTLSNVLASPLYVFEGFAASIASLLGLSAGAPAGLTRPDWGMPLLVALLALTIIAKRRDPTFSTRFWGILACAFVYWVLAAFNYIPGREAAASRYVYAGAIFVLLIAAELLEGARLSRKALGIAAGVTVLAIGPNLAQLKAGTDLLKEETRLARADTAVLEIARRTVPPALPMTPDITGTLANVAIVPGPYLEAVDAHGSPAYSLAELTEAPDNARHWADVLLSKVLPLSLSVSQRPPQATRADCVSIPGGDPDGAEFPAGPGLLRIRLDPGDPAGLTARRFATEEFPVDLGAIPGGSEAVLRVPRDEASRPWHLRLQARQRAIVCRI